MCVHDFDRTSEPKFQRKTVYLGHVLHENLQPAIFYHTKLLVQRAIQKCVELSKACERLHKHCRFQIYSHNSFKTASKKLRINNFYEFSQFSVTVREKRKEMRARYWIVIFSIRKEDVDEMNLMIRCIASGDIDKAIDQKESICLRVQKSFFICRKSPYLLIKVRANEDEVS